jgi:hypothetical protein
MTASLPVTYGRWKDMAPRHVWRRIKAMALQNARLAGLTKAEWERRRIEHGSTRGADYAMLWLPSYDGAFSEMKGARGGGGHILNGLTWLPHRFQEAAS